MAKGRPGISSLPKHWKNHPAVVQACIDHFVDQPSVAPALRIDLRDALRRILLSRESQEKAVEKVPEISRGIMLELVKYCKQWLKKVLRLKHKDIPAATRKMVKNGEIDFRSLWEKVGESLYTPYEPNGNAAAPVANSARSTETTRKRKAASDQRQVKRRSLSPAANGVPSPPGTNGPAQPTAAERSACDGPKEAPEWQVTTKGQLLSRFDIAPYAEAFKRGMLPGARRDIVVSLEEAYVGCIKPMTIKCDKFEHTVKIRVNPGTLAGHQWEYPLPDGNTVTFTLTDARHSHFRREGSDLVYAHRLTLRDALVGARIDVEIFTGEVISLESGGPVSSGATKRIAGYGMPLPEKPWKRGDLVVEFNVEFPVTVLDEHREAIKKLL